MKRLYLVALLAVAAVHGAAAETCGTRANVCDNGFGSVTDAAQNVDTTGMSVYDAAHACCAQSDKDGKTALCLKTWGAYITTPKTLAASGESCGCSFDCDNNRDCENNVCSAMPTCATFSGCEVGDLKANPESIECASGTCDFTTCCDPPAACSGIDDGTCQCHTRNGILGGVCLNGNGFIMNSRISDAVPSGSGDGNHLAVEYCCASAAECVTPWSGHQSIALGDQCGCNSDCANYEDCIGGSCGGSDVPQTCDDFYNSGGCDYNSLQLVNKQIGSLSTDAERTNACCTPLSSPSHCLYAFDGLDANGNSKGGSAGAICGCSGDCDTNHICYDGECTLQEVTCQTHYDEGNCDYQLYFKRLYDVASLDSSARDQACCTNAPGPSDCKLSLGDARSAMSDACGCHSDCDSGNCANEICTEKCGATDQFVPNSDFASVALPEGAQYDMVTVTCDSGYMGGGDYMCEGGSYQGQPCEQVITTCAELSCTGSPSFPVTSQYNHGLTSSTATDDGVNTYCCANEENCARSRFMGTVDDGQPCGCNADCSEGVCNNGFCEIGTPPTGGGSSGGNSCSDGLNNDFSGNFNNAHAECASSHGAGSSFYDGGTYTGGATDLQPDGCCTPPTGGGSSGGNPFCDSYTECQESKANPSSIECTSGTCDDATCCEAIYLSCSDALANFFNDITGNADAACVDDRGAGSSFDSSGTYTGDVTDLQPRGCCTAGSGGGGGSGPTCGSAAGTYASPTDASNACVSRHGAGYGFDGSSNTYSSSDPLDLNTDGGCCLAPPSCADMLASDFGGISSDADNICASLHGAGSSFDSNGMFTSGVTELQPGGCCTDPGGGGASCKQFMDDTYGGDQHLSDSWCAWLGATFTYDSRPSATYTSQNAFDQAPDGCCAENVGSTGNPMCDTYDCDPLSSRPDASSTECTSGTCDAPLCCESAAACDVFACPYGYTLKENPESITGADQGTCCDATAPANTCPKDLNGDNVVSAGDILAILTSFGPC